MASSMIATRRSPRSIEAFCDGLSIPGLEIEQTATLLSLAHCTGWSSDYISRKVQFFTGAVIVPEEVWDYHWMWVNGRNDGEEITYAEWEIMQCLMGAVGVVVDEPIRPLSRTMRPKSIAFAPKWSGKYDDNQAPILPGYTTYMREQNKAFLAHHAYALNSRAFGKLTHWEASVFSQFGDNMLYIFRKALANWAVAMWEQVRSFPEFTPIREDNYMHLILQHLRDFHESLEESFGMMEAVSSHSEPGRIKDDTVYIRCPGYGVKVVLGLLMADRATVIQQQRKAHRETVGYLEVNPKSLDEEHLNCPICQEPMGIASPEGIVEAPIKLVICCQQAMGSHCLRIWLTQLMKANKHRDSCPTCRYHFPDQFLQKLLGKEEWISRTRIESGDGLGGSAPEAQFEPIRIVILDPDRPLQNQEPRLQQEFAGVEGPASADLMNFDDNVVESNVRRIAGPRRRRIRFHLHRPVEIGEIVQEDFVMEG